jgi:hypothetical protein
LTFQTAPARFWKYRLDVSSSSCAYVADNLKKDFVAPNALVWLAVRIIRPDAVYCDVTCAEHGEAQHTIKTLDDLDALLK